ncbi:MAG: aminotransferase class V-fold PLP-dependent enzyme [Bacillota bacterium]
MESVIYLDNAATTWPKPAEVLQEMEDVLTYNGGNPGRGGHGAAMQAARMVYHSGGPYIPTRSALSRSLFLD